jgi:hypothetical protein
MIHWKTYTIRCLITNAIFHAYRIRWFFKQFWVIMSTGMGCIFKYRIPNISNSTEIGAASPKITQQNLNFPLSNLCSPLSALCSTLTYLSFPALVSSLSTLWTTVYCCPTPHIINIMWIHSMCSKNLAFQKNSMKLS